jgi:glycosyltransferase involved in cell wall biosynthesis
MEPRSVLYLSMHYKPEPCDTRTSVLAQEMAKRGHASTVLTSFPNYPFGKVYEGYRQRPWQRETVDGVNVVRVPMFPDHSLSVRRRALSYASFGASATVLGPVLTARPDLVWIHHPPLTTGLAGWWMSRLKRVPFVYEIHDLWPETLMSSGMVGESRITRAIRRTCDFLHRRARAIVVTSPGMKSHLVESGLDGDKVHVIPQWTDEASLAHRDRDEEFGVQHGLKGKFNLVFTGNVGAAQGGETILQAARMLQHIAEVQFVLVGAGVELGALRTRAIAMGLKNVRFLGQFRKDEVPSFFAWADALLVTLKNDPLFAITIPSKTQAYLHAGRPILCGVAGDTADVVERSRAGLTFPPEDPHALVRAICDLRSMPEHERRKLGENGRAAYDASFSARRLVDVYEGLFESVLDHRIELADEPNIELSRTA